MSLKIVLEKWSQEKALRKLLESMADSGKMTEFIPETIEYLSNQVHQHLATFDEIDDEDDLAHYTAVQYVELKARWIQMNLRLSYQAFTHGEGDPKLLLRAAATTALLSEIEPYVSRQYVEQIQALLAQPVQFEGFKIAS